MDIHTFKIAEAETVKRILKNCHNKKNCQKCCSWKKNLMYRYLFWFQNNIAVIESQQLIYLRMRECSSSDEYYQVYVIQMWISM